MRVEEGRMVGQRSRRRKSPTARLGISWCLVEAGGFWADKTSWEAGQQEKSRSR